MTQYVLLTDSDDGTALISCADQEAAEAVASSAVFSNGDVSAWLVPTLALPDSEALRDMLRDGNSTYELHEEFKGKGDSGYIGIAMVAG